jgi:serine/threonine protein kinase
MFYDRNKHRIVLDSDNCRNYFNFDGFDCYLQYLDINSKEKSYSPNGFIFKLVNNQDDFEDCIGIIKICKIIQPCLKKDLQRKYNRFEREIQSLELVKSKGLTNHVIEIYDTGNLEIGGHHFLYYVMEPGSMDLKTYLENEDIEIPQKMMICSDIIKSIKSLHEIGIYHRDIKPSNFLLVGQNWKVADLGLIKYRDEDWESIDSPREKIGPLGYLSPEALNKVFCINEKQYNIQIDNKSDVFQISLVIGFILLGEVLTGLFEMEDLSAIVGDNTDLYSLLTKSMQYAHSRRSDIITLQTDFMNAFGKKYAIQ